ncbi:MAG: discoidin domain-containing protein [Planctomycetes bacterium]|nr:discoidin domain-containing protein [Planctomycetota bacterium]
MNGLRSVVSGIVVLVVALGVMSAGAAEKQEQKTKKDEPAAEKGVPIPLKLPKPAFKGTPKHVPPGTNLEQPRKGPRPEFLAPQGTVNVSKGKPVSASDDDPIIGEIKMVTDGDNSANEGSYVELGPGLQHVQIDLKQKYRIHAVVIWHYHGNARVYHDVVVQVADDADFITNVRTVFNNDHDNSSGLGLGGAKEYWETYEGKLIDAQGVTARYVRLYSNGSTEDDQNHYTEVEVYGLPAK